MLQRQKCAVYCSALFLYQVCKCRVIKPVALFEWQDHGGGAADRGVRERWWRFDQKEKAVQPELWPSWSCTGYCPFFSGFIMSLFQSSSIQHATSTSIMIHLTLSPNSFDLLGKDAIHSKVQPPRAPHGTAEVQTHCQQNHPGP